MGAYISLWEKLLFTGPRFVRKLEIIFVDSDSWNHLSFGSPKSWERRSHAYYYVYTKTCFDIFSFLSFLKTKFEVFVFFVFFCWALVSFTDEVVRPKLNNISFLSFAQIINLLYCFFSSSFTVSLYTASFAVIPYILRGVLGSLLSILSSKEKRGEEGILLFAKTTKRLMEEFYDIATDIQDLCLSQLLWALINGYFTFIFLTDIFTSSSCAYRIKSLYLKQSLRNKIYSLRFVAIR